MHSLIPLSLFLTLFNVSPFGPATPNVYALRAPIEVRTSLQPSTRLAKRASINLPLDNKGNAQYIANITLGGTPLRVLLDTGSSDLWVNFPGAIPSVKDTGKGLRLSYAIGAASGNIHTTQFKMGNYTVENQAFLLVKDASSFSTDIHKQGYDGLLGLGPNEGSRVRDELDDDEAGKSVMTRLFETDKETTNFITVLLDRKLDPTNEVKGQFTISELVPGFEAIRSMPKIDVQAVHRLLNDEQHWQALTDKNNGIIGPDGQVIQIDTIVPKAPDGQLVAVLDTGFTFSQVPREVSDAIYGRVQGAIYDPKREWWTVPCGQMLNISFNFAGKNYPMHPLDVVDDNFNIVDPTGKKACIGSFQPITSAFSLLGNYDMILGMNFLRNVYSLYEFGNWIKSDKDKVGDPYIQILSVTDPKVAKSDFVTVRLGGTDTTSDAKWAILPKEKQQHSPVSDEEKKKKYQEMILSRWPYIFTGCLIFVLLLVGFIVWKCCCQRRKKGAVSKAPSSKFAGMFGRKKQEMDLPLGDPYLPVKATPSATNLGTYNGSSTNVNSYGAHKAEEAYHHQQQSSYGYQTDDSSYYGHQQQQQQQQYHQQGYGYQNQGGYGYHAQ